MRIPDLRLNPPNWMSLQPPNPLPRLARTLARREPVMRMRPAILRLEAYVRRLSGGSWGVLDLAGLPSVEITVRGRKSGLPRSTPLLYVPDGDRLLLVGSNWGLPKHPVWSVNLMAADTIELRERADRSRASVRLLTGAERDDAWQRATSFWPGYLMEFERSGGREFRIFEVRRIPSGTNEAEPDAGGGQHT